jgi:hypothetical protein
MIEMFSFSEFDILVYNIIMSKMKAQPEHSLVTRKATLLDRIP